MRISIDGLPDGVSGDLAALLDTDVEDPAVWVARTLAPDLDAYAADGGEHIVSMPKSLGGVTLVARVLPDGDGGDGGHLVVLKDRRQLDALQADLRLATRMRQIASRFEQTAHDLKAPLQALALNLALIREDLEEADVEDEVIARLGVLDEEVARLQRMLTLVMSEWRLPKSARLRRLDVGRLLRELGVLVRPQADARGIEVHLDAPKGLHVMAQRDGLKQALVNIINNAVDALVGHDTDEPRLEITGRADDDWVVVDVRDNGPGIPAGVRYKIFRLHFTTKDDGTGIGLPTARTTVEQLGGSLRLESSPGEGTLVRVAIPRALYDEHPSDRRA